jgi:hypothetical protein
LAADILDNGLKEPRVSGADRASPRKHDLRIARRQMRVVDRDLVVHPEGDEVVDGLDALEGVLLPRGDVARDRGVARLIGDRHGLGEGARLGRHHSA